MTNISFRRPEKAILILLKSEDKKDEEYSPIPGNTHLVKELFAICQTDLGKRLIPELKFEPDNYGPYDETVFAALESLEDGRFVSVEPHNHGNIIKLTDKGKEAADKLWAELEARNRDDIISLFSYVKRNLNHLSTDRLLDKIYAAHPEMLENSISKIADKYRPKDSSSP
jgi:uncharacterized protein YwgA